MKLISSMDSRNNHSRNNLSRQDLMGSFLHVYDTVTPEEILDLISKSGKPAVILNDHCSLKNIAPADVPNIFLPLYLLYTTRLFDAADFVNTLPETQHCFNFIINKKTIPRYLCCRIIEILGLKNYDYTWSGIGRSQDLSAIISELDDLDDRSPLTQEQRNMLLAPIEMKERFFFPDDTKTGISSVSYDFGSIRQSWDQGLGSIILKSGVSLINETYVNGGKTAVYTEKSMNSVLGLTFPIWIGGSGHADQWKDFGFDVFDDIIDHSYQHLDTLIERCWYAISDNLDILTNIDRIKILRANCHDRLLRNRNLLLNDHLYHWIQLQIQTYPVDWQECVWKVMELYDKNKSRV